MADKKISEFTSTVKVSSEELLPVVGDPNGTPTNETITFKKLFGAVPANTIVNGTFEANTDSLRITNSDTPANSTANGVGGEIKWDSNYLYVATANNVWKRVSLSSF